MIRCVTCSAMLVALCSPVRTARAQSTPGMPSPTLPNASLVVTRGEGAEDCPDAGTLAEQVRRMAGASVVQAGASSATVSATWVQVAVTHNFGGYHADISAGGLHHGARTLDDLGPGCSSIADAIAITIAIFLDPYVTAPAAASTLAPRPTPPTPPVAMVASIFVPEPVWKPRWTVDLGAGAAFSVLQHTEPLLTGRIGLRVTERWTLALGGAFVFPDSLPSPAGTVDLALSYAYLMGCTRAVGDMNGARLDWCASALGGSLRGKGVGYDDTATKQASWASIAAGPELVLPITSSLAWSLAGFGVLPVVRQSFDVENEGQRVTAFRADAVAGLVTLGVRGEL